MISVAACDLLIPHLLPHTTVQRTTPSRCPANFGSQRRAPCRMSKKHGDGQQIAGCRRRQQRQTTNLMHHRKAIESGFYELICTESIDNNNNTGLRAVLSCRDITLILPPPLCTHLYTTLALPAPTPCMCKSDTIEKTGLIRPIL